jgi:hypothetical protein
MSTARATLHADLVKMLGHKDKGDLEGQLDELLTSYRVQYKKPGDSSRKTARDALRDDLVATAGKPGKDLMAQVAQVLDEYRMQAKASGAAEGKKEPRKKAAKASAADDATPAPAGKAAARHAPAPAPRPAAPAARPAASAKPSPGPAAARGTSRSECPKCHSMGVVLARSYATDEYYSCIYCGWQGFKPAEAMEAEDSLAARLLGIYSGATVVDIADEGDGDDET